MRNDKYTEVVAAAEALATHSASDTWRLADAIRAAIRHNTHEEFHELAERLTADGLGRSNGEDYDGYGLSRLWRTAYIWPVGKRHEEASYRTHQEAGSPSDGNGKVLAALCAIARGETPKRPADVAPINWSTACDRVRARKHGFPVAANDLRLALGRLTNLPDRSGMIHTTIGIGYDRELMESEMVANAISSQFESSSALTLLLQAQRYVDQGVKLLAKATITEEIKDCLDAIQSAIDSVKAPA